jgi:hypothetical protein
MNWLLVLLPLAQPDDKAAEALFKAFRDRVEGARTIRVEFTLGRRDRPEQAMSGALKIKGKDRWALRLYSAADPTYSQLSICDGHRVVAIGDFQPVPAGSLEPAEFGAELRQLLCTSSYLLRFSTVLRPATALGVPLPLPEAIKDGGKANVGGTEARVIEYAIKYDVPSVRGRSISARFMLDASTGTPLGRETLYSGRTWVESYVVFAFDEDLPDAEFVYTTVRRLARARTEQLARSVDLFTRFTGRHPRALEDLLKRPAYVESEAFWPEGGFVLGDALPKDPWGRPFQLRADRGRLSVASLGADGKEGGKGDDQDAVVEVPAATRRAVGAPSERLQQHYTARTQLQLLSSAAKAYLETYGEAPADGEALGRKPEGTEVWPEGGWLPKGKPPVDPWGNPYRITQDSLWVRAQVADRKARTLSARDLTEEERRRLEEATRPRVSADERKELERLVAQLGDESLAVRDAASSALKGWAAASLAVVEDRLKAEKDPEALERLRAVRQAALPRQEAWAAELRPLSASFPRTPMSPAAGRAACANNLAQLWKMANIYMSKFGGPNHDFARDTGRDFWLVLMKSGLIDKDIAEIMICPMSDEEKGEGVCTFAGPASDVNSLPDAGVVGLCDDEGHGEQVIILRKSGDVNEYPRGGEMHERALRETRR